MDKSIPKENKTEQLQPGCQLNTVDIMQNEPNKKADCSPIPAKSSKDKGVQDETPIGDASLDNKGTIKIQLRRTADGINISGTIEYPVGNENYDRVMKHLGGLMPGESKLVFPWKEDEEQPQR